MSKSALITGGAKRIGKAIAICLAERGYDIVIHYSQSKKEAEELVIKLKSLGVEAFCVKANLLKDFEISTLVDKSKKIIGKPLDLLINNASIFENDSLTSLTLESWDRHLFTNLKAPVFLSKEFSIQVPDNSTDENNEILASSNIINIIDQKVLNLNPRFFSYTLAKSSLLNFTKLSAQELGPKIRVNAIGPGPTLKASHQSEEQFQNQRKSTLLKRGSDVKEICRTILYILSSPGLTGQLITLDGGEHLTW
ncbi:MAG: SDR family oxidoreductase [Paracoccaceae bacterium]